jgi:hypothetical protein
MTFKLVSIMKRETSNLQNQFGNSTWKQNFGEKTIENTLQQNFNVSSNVEVFLHNITFL